MAGEGTAVRVQSIVASNVTLALAALASALITLALFSAGKPEKVPHSPASNAAAVYGDLMAQIYDSSPTPGVAAPSNVMAPGGRTHEQPAKLSRDLFAPPRRKPYASQKRVAPAHQATGPRVPRLTAILIDGASRQAMVGRAMISQGDIVSGYTVVEIARGWVVLQKDGVSYTLRVGEKQ